MSSRRRSIHALVSASLVAVLATATMQGFSQSAGAEPAPPAPDGGGYWSETSARPQSSKDGHTRRVNPRDFAGYRLDSAALADRLGGAPMEGAKAAPLVVAVPAPNGELVDFAVTESPVMESGLAADHPEISTFAGRAVKDPTATIRLDLTPMGFHASVRGSGEQGAWHVDPAYNGDDSLYLSYLGSALPAPQQPLVEPELDQSTIDDVVQDEGAGEAPGTEVSLRTYRLALVTDPSYAAYFGTENVLAEKVTLMNRVNHIYNDDLAIRMTLINQTDLLNLDTAAEATEPNGPCGTAPCFTTELLDDGCTGNLLNRNRIVIGQLVGASQYDIGHIGLGINGGGVAQLNSVGGNGKARGCTGLPTPEGDFFAVDYVAHEMGHQFGGPHTFNGNQLNCQGNRSGSPIEPGSGSSVMAYAGICRQDDLQPHSDPYFSQRSITDLTNYVTSARAPINEVQTVSLRNFDGTDSFTLTYEGATTAPIVRGTNYNNAGIDAALEAVLGVGTVRVDGWTYSGSLAPVVVDDTGFQVTFDGGALAATNLENLEIAGAGDVEGFVGETAKGGAIDNAGRTITPSGNFAPVATAPAPKTIPARTPFALTGTATDPDGDPLVYILEQNDRGGATGVRLGSQVKPDGALFRIFGQYAPVTPAGTLQTPSPGLNLAGSNPTRVFPDLAQILANNTNAATGTCPEMPPPPTTGPSNVPIPTRECFSEWLPTADYVGSALAPNVEPSLNFRFTARDLDPAAGGYAFGDVKLTLDSTKGPFLVTSQATAAPVTGGANAPVTWAVNGTQTLAPNVRITLSTDGGNTFGTVLAASTPNDGSQTLMMPNITTDQARIKIEAVDNYFFDINEATFTILADPNAPDTTITAGPKRNGFDLDRRVSFEYTSTEPGSTFACARDDKPGTCGADRVTVRVRPGTHTFSVAAVDASGNEDPTPATRTWARPLDDRALARAGFNKQKARAAYRNTYVEADRRGATLTKRVKKAKKIALVVGTGKGFGKVDVFLGKNKLRTINLASKKTRYGVLVKVKTFAKPRSGKVTIRTKSGKTVRIDGLGVLAKR